MKKKTVELSPDVWEKLKESKSDTGVIMYRIVNDLLRKALKINKTREN